MLIVRAAWGAPGARVQLHPQGRLSSEDMALVLASLTHRKRSLVHPSDASAASAGQVVRLLREHESWERAQKSFQQVDLKMHTIRHTLESVERAVHLLSEEAAAYV